MPRRNANRVESASGGEGAVVLGDAFQQVAQGLARIQEALQLQGQEAERRLQEAVQRVEQEAERRLTEALRVQEQRAATALREAVAQMERKLQEKDTAIRDLQERVEEMKVGQAVRDGKANDLEGAVQQVEGSVQAVEASLQRAMQTFFPRVDGLLRQLEENPSPGAASSFPSPTASAGNTCAVTATGGAAAGGREENPRPSASSASSTSSYASALGASVPEGAAGDRRGGAGADQGTGDADENLQGQSVEWQILRRKQRARRTRATRSRLGEDLLRAAEEGRLADVRRLLDHGADVNYVDSEGYTPLMYSVVSAQPEEVVALLLERGADANAVNTEGSTAMHWAACMYKSGRCVDLLVAAGGDVNARDERGATPLHCAADGNEAAVRALLSAGARKDLKAWGGIFIYKTPYEVAKKATIKDLLRL